MTAGGREFQVAGAAQLKDRFPISVRLVVCVCCFQPHTKPNAGSRVPLLAHQSDSD